MRRIAGTLLSAVPLAIAVHLAAQAQKPEAWNVMPQKVAFGLIESKRLVAQTHLRALSAGRELKPEQAQVLRDLIQATHARDPVRLWAAEALRKLVKDVGARAADTLRKVMTAMGGTYAKEAAPSKGTKKTEHVPAGFRECNQSRECILDRAFRGLNGRADYVTGFALGDHGFRMFPLTAFKVGAGEYELWMQLRHVWRIGQDDLVNICFRMKEKRDYDQRKARLEDLRRRARAMAACKPAFDKALAFAEKHRVGWLDLPVLMKNLAATWWRDGPKLMKEQQTIQEGFTQLAKKVPSEQWKSCWQWSIDAGRDLLYLETRYDLGVLDVAKLEGVTFRAIAAVANFPFRIMSLIGVPFASLGTLVVGKIYQSRDLSWKDASDGFALDLATELTKGRVSPAELARKATPKRSKLRPEDVARLGALSAELVCPPKNLKRGAKNLDTLFDLVQGFR